MKKLFVPVTILALAVGTTFTSCNSDDDDDLYDPSSARKKGAGPKINVKKTKW